MDVAPDDAVPPGDPFLDLIAAALGPLPGDPDPSWAARIAPLARDLYAQVAPRDPAEQMLAAQMVATFARSMFLARHANRQRHPKWFSLYSAECDRATDLYRRQMRALDEHRAPRRATFTAIRTANIAGQQVVVTPSPTPPPPGGPPLLNMKAECPSPPIPSPSDATTSPEPAAPPSAPPSKKPSRGSAAPAPAPTPASSPPARTPSSTATTAASPCPTPTRSKRS
jgi:hypothetical protein